jgi:hypothetical protein
MKQKRITILVLAVGCLLVVSSAAFLMTIPANAQCGSQSSSCKNCHETQAQDPVNNDGTAWHSEHAFGDFCYLCHGGNNQAMDETTAHAGMTDPLSDIVINCKSCHPTDYTDKAQIYATTLGITLTSGGSSGVSTPAATTSASTESTPTAIQQTVPSGIVGTNTDMVDYVQRYDQIVLGKNPVNVGNVILLIMAIALFFGGGYFIASREGWLKISFAETSKIKDGYPVDVVNLVPEIVKLSPEARKSLQHLLEKPSSASDFLNSVGKLIQDINPEKNLSKNNEPSFDKKGEEKE